MLSFHTEAKRSPRSGLPIRSFEAEVEAGPEDLTVTRFNDEAGEWQALETELLETTDDYVRLEAETPGFSYFAVTAVDPPVAALSAPEEVEVGEEVTFDASDSTSEDAEIVAYDWTVDGESVDGTETMT
ncbi:MAG: PGF-pre-PGF domain-containing protein, partial [Halodesulfurarchaeum sp.]